MRVGWLPSISPDGTLAAYRSNESGQDEIYIRGFPTPGERTVVSRGGGLVPFWARDGNTLYYAVPTGLLAAHLQREPVPVVLSTDTLFVPPPGFGEPFPGSALHPAGDRFIFAIPAGGGAEAPEAEAVPQRLILVLNFFEELKRLVAD